jgi:RHS repeat-associated protein
LRLCVKQILYDGTLILKFILSDEGRLVFDSAQTPGSFDYEYFIKDHLGNNRVSIKESNGNAVVMQEDHYYPFGMVLGGQSYAYADPLKKNDYLFGGKEFQNELGLDWYDYGARFYDPTIGRFFATDPKSENFQSWSSYNYCLNNPIIMVDPDGMNAVYRNGGYEDDETGEKRTWEQVQKEYGIGNYSNGPLNVLIIDQNADQDFTLNQMLESAKEFSSINVLQVSDTHDAAGQLSDLVENKNKKVDNLILGGHGEYEQASFTIGYSYYSKPSDVLNDKDLSTIGNSLDIGSQVVLWYCHTGSSYNGGTSLLKAMASKLKTTVFGSQSWAFTGRNMFNGVNPTFTEPSHMNGSYPDREERKHAFDNYNKWTKVTYNNGRTFVSTVSNLYLTKTGCVRYNNSNF